MNRQWIDRFYNHNGRMYIVLDMDKSVKPTNKDKESAAYNRNLDYSCYRPNFVFNQFGVLERCALQNYNGYSYNNLMVVINPVIARNVCLDVGGRPFPGNTSYATPMIHERPQQASDAYAIRLPANSILRWKVAHRLIRYMERTSQANLKQFFEDLHNQAASGEEEHQMVTIIEVHLGEHLPRLAFILTNLAMEPNKMVRLYKRRSVAEQHIKEGIYTFDRTRLSWRKWHSFKVRLQLSGLVYNLPTFLRFNKMSEEMA